ncbi:MAG TPA: hypothetical protein VLG25_00045 [Patescibacteria group bacterium]|nr:hypothetical protein [Patescibacteria group bacterium]
MRKTSLVLYKRPEGHSEIVVTRVKPGDQERLAGQALDVMAHSYERQFEEEQALLTHGSAREEFNAESPSRLARQAERMGEYILRGSVYWLAYEGRYSNKDAVSAVGLAETSPSRPGLKKMGPFIPGLDRPNCFLNDLAVVPGDNDIASCLLHTALADYGEKAKVLADVLPGQESFYTQNEFTLLTSDEFEETKTLSIGSSRMRTLRYGAAAVSGVREALLFHHPWLEDRLEEAVNS